MDERMTRLWAGAEAEAIGRGGLAMVSRATGLALNTVKRGRNELRDGAKSDDIVRATIDRRRYPIGKKVTPKQMRELKIEPHTFHGDWNYTIHPRPIAP